MLQILLIIILILHSSILIAKYEQKVWIYFKDKGKIEAVDINREVRLKLSERAFKRRLEKVGSQPFDYTDLPILPSYKLKLKQLGVKIQNESNWFNAVSAYIKDCDFNNITKLPFVKKIEPVRTYRYKKYTKTERSSITRLTNSAYGPSENQNAMLGVISAHNKGYHGENVRIAIFDSGFILQHEALQHVKVIDTYDFIQNDRDVSNQEGDLPKQHDHGTLVLSVIAGYSPGQLIGPAYAAEYLLAKTEDIGSETSLEEDNSDRLGADIISTSIGYGEEMGYSYEDMDGNSTIITQAADLAVKKGIAVFASAGNEGSSSWYHILAPADGDSVIALGGVNPDRTLWPKSSRGPTFDGRIKPELMAQGKSVYTVNPNTDHEYSYLDGTSLACPLGSGVAAIILSLAPQLKPMELRELLITNASQSNQPDNNFGYGIIDLSGVLYNLTHDPAYFLVSFKGTPLNGRNMLSWQVRGVREITSWILEKKFPDNEYQEIEAYPNRLSLQEHLFVDYDITPDGVYYYRLGVELNSGEKVSLDSVIVNSVPLVASDLFHNYPNPFNVMTTITVSLVNSGKINLKIFDLNGRLIKTLADNESKESGYYYYQWQGRNNNNQAIASGTYYAVLSFKDETKSIKILYLK